MSALFWFSIGVIFSATVFFVAALCSAAHKRVIPPHRFLEPRDLEDGR